MRPIQSRCIAKLRNGWEESLRALSGKMQTKKRTSTKEFFFFIRFFP